MKINIAIDGPSAAGKSTISDILAKKLGYVHLDTGAMYRCIALKALKKSISLDDGDRLAEMLKNTTIQLKSDGTIYLDGVDVSLDIRQDHISMAASTVSKQSCVRTHLVSLQQKLAQDKGIIMDGRDIGTVVLKGAELKIYLTASVHSRALRRLKQNLEKGLSTSDIETLEKEIADRDEQDMTRANSPLKKADDAIEVDSSNISIEEVVEQIYLLAKQKIE